MISLGGFELEIYVERITGPRVEINTPRRTRKAGRVTRPVRQSFFREDVAQHRKRAALAQTDVSYIRTHSAPVCFVLNRADTRK